MVQKKGSIQRKIVIALLTVGIFSGLVALLFTYLTETTTLDDFMAPVFQAILMEAGEPHIHSYSLFWKILILGPVALALLSLPVYFSAKWIARPIKILSEEADLIGQGHLSHGLKIKTGDEIEKLADTFAQMAQDLERRFEEIRIERDKLNTVMDSIGDGLVILDQDCNIRHMNAKFIELYGKESIGRSCREVFGMAHSNCNKCSVRIEEDFKPHTLEAITDKGLSYLITHSRIRNLDGTVSIVEIFKDITERKRIEQQLLHSERLTALSQFSSSFAHDLRNPIIAIKKTIEMLRDSSSFSQKEPVREVYTDIISTCGLLLGLVNDVLDIHQVSYRDLPLLYSSFSLNQALEEVVKLMRIEAEEKKIHIEIDGQDKDVWIEGDKRRIQRVFINLLSNAIRYSPPSGKVRMFYQTCHSPSPSPNPSGNSNLLFKIEDEGPGIATSDLSKVFNLFYKKNRDGIKGGTGLGLYFCKVVVDAHGGRVWAENREKGGAAFYINIPLVRREADAYQNSHSG